MTQNDLNEIYITLACGGTVVAWDLQHEPDRDILISYKYATVWERLLLGGDWVATHGRGSEDAEGV